MARNCRVFQTERHKKPLRLLIYLLLFRVIDFAIAIAIAISLKRLGSLGSKKNMQFVHLIDDQKIFRLYERIIGPCKLDAQKDENRY